jgi:hypothetical protein
MKLMMLTMSVQRACVERRLGNAACLPHMWQSDLVHCRLLDHQAEHARCTGITQACLLTGRPGIHSAFSMLKIQLLHWRSLALEFCSHADMHG